MIKARIFVALLGFLLALGGIYFDNRQLIWAAMAVLGVTLALRYRTRGRVDSATEDLPQSRGDTENNP